MKKKSFILLAIMVAIPVAVAYFLFGVYDKSDAMQEKLPPGLVIMCLAGIGAILFHFVDKAFRKSLKQ